MIKEFKGRPIREGGGIYRSYYEKAKMLYEQDPMKGGELAMSILEQLITGQISTDDVMIKIAMTEIIQTSDKKADEWDKKMEAQRQARIEKMSLDKIAQLYTQGRTQREIGSIIGVTQQVVSNRLQTIRKDFPELLATGDKAEESKVQEEPTKDFVF